MVKNLPANAGDAASVPGPEDPTGCGSAKPTGHNYWACALEPGAPGSWAEALQPPKARRRQSLRCAAREATKGDAFMPQLEQNPAAMKTQHSQK